MVGIDFGTSNTVVTARSSAGVEILPLGAGERSLPTLLFVNQGHQVSIGHEARRAHAEAALHSGGGAAPFRLFQALKLALKDPDLESTNVFGRQVRLETIVSWYLAELRRRILLVLPGWDGHAVVGRPVELSPDPRVDLQLQRRFEAAFLAAGFSSVKFVYEPVAAAVDLVGSHEGRVLVFDFGGGTLDVSVATLAGNTIAVPVSVGRDLGGYLLDEDLARGRVRQYFGYGGKLRTLTGQWLEVPHDVTGQVVRFKVLPFDEIRRIKRLIPELLQEAIDKPALRGLLAFLERNLTYDLYQALDQTKIALSDALSSTLNFQVPPHVALHEVVTRAELEDLLAPRVAEAEHLVLLALSLAGLAPGAIDQVVRVGGSSQIPIFHRMLEQLFPGRLTAGRLFEGIALGLLPAFERGLTVRPS
ncbi:MAG: Hsp70 family protein [Spirochaetales bacterium]